MGQVFQELKTVLARGILSFVPLEPQVDRCRLADYWEVVAREFAQEADCEEMVDLEGTAAN